MSEDDFFFWAAAFPEPLLVVDREGALCGTNAAAERLLGASGSELEGIPLEDLVLDKPSLREFLRDCSGGRTMIPGRLRLRGADGTALDCRVDAAAFGRGRPDRVLLRPREAGDRNPFLLLNRKIDELSQEIGVRMRLAAERETLLESERAARGEAEHANRLRDEFLATLSHELRTPLNAIIGWSSMLQAGVGLDKADTGLETIYRAARSQERLIDDLLDVSRIIMGKLRLESRPIEVSEIVREAVESVEPAARAKGVRLQSFLDAPAGAVSGDPDRIRQVVWNLLSNAIKFTPRGGNVEVRVEPAGAHVEIVVRDDGEGIDAATLPFIFERLRQGEGSLTRAHEGLGLGLSIVRHLVEAHGGDVGAESAGRGRGATFTVRLPLIAFGRPAAVAPHPAEQRSVPALPGIGLDRLAHLRLLILTDDADSRETLAAVLVAAGARVRVVATAAAALAEMEAAPPDAVLSDLDLRGEDGYALIREIRARAPESGGRVPVVALTSFGRPVDRVRSLEAGFQMHLHKPVDLLELIAVIRSVAAPTGPPEDAGVAARNRAGA